MNKHRFLLPAALALAMTAANADQSSNAGCDAVLSDPNISSEIKQAVRAQMDAEEQERAMKLLRTANTADTMKTTAPDVKEQSCFDKYSNFKIVVGVGFPTMDAILEMLMKQLTSQACQIVDKQVNNVTGGVNGAIGKYTNGVNGATGGMIDTNVNVGTGSGGSQFKTKDTSNTAANRVGQAVGGLFR